MSVICYICKKSEISPTRAVNNTGQRISAVDVSCAYCGSYQISEEAILTKIPEMHLDKLYLLSAAIFNNTEHGELTILTIESIPQIIKNIKRKSPPETIDNILKYISQKANSITDFISFSEKDVPRFILKDKKELYEYLLQIEKLGFWELKKYEPDKQTVWKREVKLTLKGWDKIAELNELKVDSNQAFVAMWFDDPMDQYYFNGIKPALEKTGFNPIVRVKETQHNEKVDDLIVAQIRRSGLLIAECTGNRPAVYYEAGLARGLNMKVIWLCRESDLDHLSFDTRQYKHIVWKNADDLQQQLILRIEATIPGHLSK